MSFLSDFEQYTEGNECPQTFRTWGALTALSNLVAGRVWADQGIFTVFPNMYVVFVGEPGSKKSTAMRMSYNVIKQFKKITPAPASMTKEAMVQMMAIDDSPCKAVFKYQDKPVHFTQLAVYANELVNLINSGGNPGAMIDFFTDVWDLGADEWRDKTKNKGDHTIIRPFITITGCMTYESIKIMQNLKIISSGMTRRCLFIHGSLPDKPVAFPNLQEYQKEAFKRMIAYAVNLFNASGVFEWEDAAKAKFQDLYDNVIFKNKRTEPSKIYKEFLETKPEYILKIAMLLWLSEETKRLVLTEENIQRAYDLISSVDRGGAQLFEGSGRNVLAGMMHDLTRMVGRQPNGVLPMKQIYFTFSNTATNKEVEQMIDDGIKMGQLVRFKMKNPRTQTEYADDFISTPAILEQLKGKAGTS